MTPRYEHNATSCIFLGQFNNYDLYFYTDHYYNVAVIARYGPGVNYISNSGFNIVTAKCIIEASKRAYTMFMGFQRLI